MEDLESGEKCARTSCSGHDSEAGSGNDGSYAVGWRCRASPWTKPNNDVMSARWRENYLRREREGHLSTVEEKVISGLYKEAHIRTLGRR